MSRLVKLEIAFITSGLIVFIATLIINSMSYSSVIQNLSYESLSGYEDTFPYLIAGIVVGFILILIGSTLDMMRVHKKETENLEKVLRLHNEYKRNS